MITVDQLCRAMPSCPRQRAATLIGALNNALVRADINTKPRIAAFLAQVGHESLDLTFMKETASGDAYEGRADLGNTQPGDGRRFKGRGPIQVTGRANYMHFGVWSGLDAVNHPELLEEPDNGFLASAWFWMYRDLNQLADTGDFLRISTRINGRNKDGLPNGWPDRQARLVTATEALA